MKSGSTPFAWQIPAPPLLPSQLKPGVARSLVDATIGAPTKTIGTTALYSYSASDNEHKIMAGYFDTSGHLQRFARYALKGEKIVDEISNTELSEGRELPAIRALPRNRITRQVDQRRHPSRPRHRNKSPLRDAYPSRDCSTACVEIRDQDDTLSRNAT